MSLRNYRKKRDFKKTPEPQGAITQKKHGNGLYLIQKHAASHLHYDFRLELNGVLLSWAVPKGPSLDPSIKRLAIHVEDHPLEYGSFEGIIPKGQYGGGTVMLWDTGEWICENENPVAAYHKGHLSFILKGKKLKGGYSLVRIRHDDKTWLLIKTQDKYARPESEFNITLEKPNSVVSKKSIDEIAEQYDSVWGKQGAKKAPAKKSKKTANKNPRKKIQLDLKTSSFPKIISPQLATLVDEPPNEKKWLHEIKFDGYRLLAIKKNGKTTLLTRNHNNWTKKFLSVAKAIDQLPIDNLIIDGEVVVLDEEQRPNFQLLQNSIKDGDDVNFIYYAFDILYYDQYSLTSLPLIERKKILQKVLSDTNNEILRFSDHVLGSGKKVFEKSCELGLEGIVSKDSTSPYLQKRGRNWLKIKCVKRQEFVIGGFTQPSGSREYFGALLIGTYNNKHELIYNGHVGTGFSNASLKKIHQALSKFITPTMPFAKKPPLNNKTTWVMPTLVAEVEFAEWTADNIVRHASFKGLRTDKPASEIGIEKEVSIKSSKRKQRIKKMTNDYPLTNPNKILYPEDEITKQDIADYYASIKKWILPYIIERPLTIVRCPDGYRECFYQKHINKTTPPSLHGITIKEKKSKEECIYIKDEAGLMGLVQLGSLEIHTWGSDIEKVEYPDMIVFDLDPSPDVEWKEVVKAALEVKKHLSEYQLTSFVKTTGGKGLHVVIPIKPEFTWDEIKHFAHTFANFMVMQNPDKYVDVMNKVKRKGKIFIDYMRNQRGATAIAPYSTRAREHAPVATPFEWDELTNKQKDTFYTIKTLPNRLDKLKHDPWKAFFKIKQSLRHLFK